jgi:chemotaxis protein MotB
MKRRRLGDESVEQRVSSRGRISRTSNAKWLITFNDLITLMMVFFVLVFAMSKGDMAKIKQFRSAIIHGFGALEKKSVERNGLIEDTRPQMKSGDKLQKQSVPEAIRDMIEKIDALPEVETENSDKGLVIRIAGNIFFDSGSSMINPSGFSLLKKIGSLISQLPNRVRIEGYTDNVPIATEAFPSNWELSAARAVSIVKFLSDRMNVYPRRLSAVGYGESRPIKANDTPENRALNRRVEIVLLKDKGK